MNLLRLTAARVLMWCACMLLALAVALVAASK